jgi:hypothetical protein
MSGRKGREGRSGGRADADIIGFVVCLSSASVCEGASSQHLLAATRWQRPPVQKSTVNVQMYSCLIPPSSQVRSSRSLLRCTSGALYLASSSSVGRTPSMPFHGGLKLTPAGIDRSCRTEGERRQQSAPVRGLVAEEGRSRSKRALRRAGRT